VELSLDVSAAGVRKLMNGFAVLLELEPRLTRSRLFAGRERLPDTSPA
jgi:hypothetical protein